MNLNFRQGLISYQQTGSQPQYLQPSATTGFIDLNVSPSSFVGTIAHGSSDYLLKFDASILAAWGPLVAGVDNYLYFDLNLITGAVTRGIATLAPIVSATAPVSPVTNQMWFDSVNTVFKFWNGNGTKWVDAPRLVVGRVIQGNPNQIVMYNSGSNVGLNNTPGTPGFLMLDTMLRPLRTSLGELLTMSSPVRAVSTIGTSGVLTTPSNNFIPVRANEAIPPMGLVYFSSSDGVSLASSDPSLVQPRTPIGIVENGLALNDIGVVTQVGEIVYDTWNWAPDQIGQPLYCDFNGNLTTTRPSSIQAFRCGWIKNSNTVLFYIDSETTPQVYSAPGAIISGAPPIVVTNNINGLGENVSTISMAAATETNDGYMTMAQATLIDTIDARLTTDEANIALLQTSKMDVGAAVPISQVTNLQTTLTGLQSTKADKVIAGNTNDFVSLDGTGNLLDSGYSGTSFALVAHVHQISDITNLQTDLNALQPLIVPGLTTQYYRGDKTWQTLDSAAIPDLSTTVNDLITAANLQPLITAGTTAQYYRGDLTWQDLNAAAIPDFSSTVLSDVAPSLLLKADKVVGATAGDFAALDASGNLVDSLFGPGSFAAFNHTQTIATINGLQVALNALQPLIMPGTTAQYWRGDETWQTLDTTVLPDFSSAVNSLIRAAGLEPAIPPGLVTQYWRGDETWQVMNTTVLPDFSTSVNSLITAANLQPAIPPGLVTQYWRGDETWQVLNTTVLPDFSTAVNALITAANLEPAIAPGTTAQYWRGDKTWQTFPTLTTTLAALTDVQLSSPIDQNLLVYNGTAAKWENVPLGQVEVQNI